MSIAAIIPARGGSKRIPHKNIKLFCGKPMITYSIEAAIDSGIFDRIIVSTDSKQVASIAKDSGAEIPFMRPAELADDFTDTAPVLLHALNWLSGHGFTCDYFCCIYATAPLIQADYIIEGFNLIKQKKATTTFSVATFPYPIFRALKIDEDGCIEMFWPEHENSRSNNLPDAYHDAGQFYWVDTKRFLAEQKLFSSNSIPVILPRYLVQDIDTLEDWETAEKMFSALQLDKTK
jgi:pseudaminic acid cytidylyltransferase